MLFSKSRCITALFLLMLPAAVQAQFNYITNGNSITITGYTGPGGAVVIPASTNGYPVTTIGDFAFIFSSLSSVTIPDSVTLIGELAFYNCTNLSFVDIPDSVTGMGIGAFGNCASLTSASFDGNTPLSDNTVFQGDPVTVYYQPGTTNWLATFGGALTVEETAPAEFTYYTNNGSILIQRYSGTDSKVVIPPAFNGYPVTTIGEFSFDVTSLSSVIIPPTVNSIGLIAFFGCTNLSAVTIPASVTNIAGEAFANCTNLTSAWFQGNAPPDNGMAFSGDPATVYYLPGTTNWSTTFGTIPTVEETPSTEFGYTTNDDSITITNYIGSDATVIIPDRINGYAVTSIGDYAFLNSTVTNVVIPNSVTNIGNSAFFQCLSLTSVTMGNSVNSIGFEAFLECVKLTGVTLPNSVASIGYQAFTYCSQLTSVIIPNSVTNIGGFAFRSCSSLTNEVIPDSVISIGSGPFAGCSSLTNISVDPSNPAYTSVNGVLFDKAQATLIQYPNGLTNDCYTIPDGVTNIGEAAFYWSVLSTVVIPNSVVSIGTAAFDVCLNLTSVALPNGLTTIGEDAFYECNSLTNIIIPANVTTIGDHAFAYSSAPLSAYFEGNAPPDDGTVFYNDPATVYYLPGTTGWGTTYGNVPTQLWFQPQPQVLTFEPSFGVQNNQFGFTVSWATNTSVVVQACTNLSNPVWIPVATNALNNGTNFFSDPSWANYPNRYYRISAT